MDYGSCYTKSKTNSSPTLTPIQHEVFLTDVIFYEHLARAKLMSAMSLNLHLTVG